MNLKQNIGNTNELKNKVKLANTRIKETVIRGGGYDFKSLDKAPERIKRLLKQYNKIAYLDYSSSPINLFKQTNIKLNLDFEPKKLIIIAVNKRDVNKYDAEQISAVSPNPFDLNDFNEIHYVRDGNTEFRRFTIKGFSKTEIIFKQEYCLGVTFLGIAQIIAIG